MPALNWIGKDKIINYANKIPYHVLNHKYNFQAKINSLFENENNNINTGNKIIHGDNLIALKSLLPEYAGKIKCVYIDPPYNTGNENWVYNDNVSDPRLEKWLGEVVGKEGEDFTRHDKWLCMMYPRLQLLKDLLSDDGAIFISIDDNEQANLKLICDEIFGANNFVAELVWNLGTGTTAGHFTRSHEYVFCYAKAKDNVPNFKNFNENENIKDRAVKKISAKNPPVEITFPAGFEFEGEDAVFTSEIGNAEKEYILSDEMRFHNGKLAADTTIRAGFAMRNQIESFIRGEKVLDSKGQPVKKFYFNKSGVLFYEKEKTIINPKTVLSDLGSTKNGTNDLKAILGDDVFSFPKPVELIKFLIQLITDKNSIILDSFAGSGTTAHAVLNLNKLDNGKRKFILIELEDYADNITAERVRRVMQGYNNIDGTGGSFDFYEVGEPIMINGELNKNLDIKDIYKYIWQAETGEIKDNFDLSANKYYLGDYDSTAIYFYYEPDNITRLDYEFLAQYIKHKSAGYIIYADTCMLGDEFMSKNNIEFKKIPRDIKKFWSED